MRRSPIQSGLICLSVILAGGFCTGPLFAQALFAQALYAQEDAAGENTAASILSDSKWEEVDRSVDRALKWMARQQKADGSFPTIAYGQPGVTGLCTMAFLAQGHVPNEGKYGRVLANSLDYIIACQQQNGLLGIGAPDGAELNRNVNGDIGVAVSYSHAIAGLVLCEAYAMSSAETTRKMQPVIETALKVSFEMHDWPKERAIDRGGWRYLQDSKKYDSDLSVTGWHLMFLRSAKNAGFDVEKDRIDRAVGYVRRCFQKKQGSFAYRLDAQRINRTSRGIAGAGILALAHSGLHNTDEAQQAGRWIQKSGFHDYNAPGRLLKANEGRFRDTYFYGLLTCSQAMYQLGGHHWSDFFPPMAEVLIRNQNADGSWDIESHHNHAKFGNTYTTASSVLALSASSQLLPIFQR